MSTAVMDHGMALFFPRPSAGPVIADITDGGSIGTGTSNTSSTTVTITTTQAVPAGALLCIAVVSDNSNASTPTFTCADNSANGGAANTYTAIYRNSGQATAAAGIASALIYSLITRPLNSGATITITLSAARVGKAAVGRFWNYATSTLRGSGNANSATSGTAASVATTGTAPVTGDLVVGMIASEHATVPTADSDTLNGSWTAGLTQAGGGATTAGVSVQMQGKVVTAGGHQTYNATVVTSDRTSIITAFQPAFAVAPDAPTSVAGTGGNTQVSLTWTAPAVNGGKTITGYAIRNSSNGGTDWTTFTANTGSAATSATVTGLTNGTGYIFQVAAINAAGTGVWSSSSSTVTPAAGGGSPQFRSASGAIDTVNATTTSITVTKPAGVVEGDYLIAHFRGRTVDASGLASEFSAPDGTWTRIVDVNGDDSAAVVWGKFAGPSEPASYTFSQTAAEGRMAIGMAAYTGVNATTPVDASASTTDLADDLAAPSVTTTVANTRVIRAWGWRGSDGASSGYYTVPGGTTERWEQADTASGTAWNRVLGADAEQASAGASGTATPTGGPSDSNRRNAMTIALRPA